MTLDNDQIVDWIEQLEKESKAFKEEILKICWFMRGGINYEEAMQLSYDERQLISKIIKENLETAKKSGMPFF